MSADASHERGRALSTEERLNAWLDRARAKAGEADSRNGLLLEHMRSNVAHEQAGDVHVRTEAEATAGEALSKVRADADQALGAASGVRVREGAEHTKVAEVAQVREKAREAQRRAAQPIDQVRAEASPEGTEPQADADEGLAARERRWRADGDRAQEAAVKEARASAETEAAATLAAERMRWADDAERALAAAVKQAQADADQALAAAVKQAQAHAAAHAQEAAVKEARAMAETEAAATLAAEQARWADDADRALAAAVEVAIREARSTTDAELARVRAEGKQAVSLAVASVRSEAEQARTAAIRRVRTQVRHALLQSKRIIAQVRDEAKRQREAAEDELRRVTEALTARIETQRAEGTTEREDAVREARIAAQAEAAATLAAEQARGADDADQALTATVEPTPVKADGQLASRERLSELDLRLLDSDVQPEDVPETATVEARHSEDISTQQATVQAASTTVETELATEQDRRKPRDLNETPGSTRGDDAPPATPDVHEAPDPPGSDGELDLRLLDIDGQVRDGAAMAAVQAWQTEDDPTQQAAVTSGRATTEPIADRQSPPTAPEALPATGWTRFLRRSKSPGPSAKGPSSGS